VNEWLYGYFGVGSPEQIVRTSAHVSFVHVMDWGDWDSTEGREAIKQQQIAYMQEARARGVKSFVVTVGFLAFDSQRHYRGSAQTITAVKAYLDQLAALDLSRDVIAIYVLDEPDIDPPVDDRTMAQAFNDVRAAWPGPKLAVIYGDHGTPGIAAADWIGHDDYGRGAGVLDRMPAIRADQRWIVVPGGADPWRQDPSPFVSRADSDPRIAVVMPFVFFDRKDERGVTFKGIGSNGMLPQYEAAAAHAS
jgi:hypothetical protein